MVNLKRPVYRVITFSLGAVLVTFFLVGLGFTQTQVGRDALKVSLESWFADSFEGRLAVGTIRGSLLWNLDLQDVRLYDASDSLMVQAGAVTMRPRWLDLASRDFNVRELVITDVDVFARYLADSTWNLSSIRPMQPVTAPSRPWELQSARIAISRGRIVSTRESPFLLQDSTVLDITDLTVDEINLEAQLRLESDEYFFLVQELTAALPDQGVANITAGGELLFQADYWQVNYFSLRSGASHINLTGIEDVEANSVSINITESVLTPGFARVFLPTANLPDTLSVAGGIGFQSQSLIFNELRIASGQSYVLANGTLGESSFEIDVEQGTLGADDLKQFFPNTSGVPAIDSLAIKASGTFRAPGRNGQAAYVLHTSAGPLSGSISFEEDSVVTYTMEVEMQDFNPGWLYDARAISALNGTAKLEGSSWQSPEMNLWLFLSPSVLSGHSLDSLRLQSAYADGQLSADARAYSGSSEVDVEASYAWNTERPRYQLKAIASQLDLGNLLPDSHFDTELNATLNLTGSGSAFDDAEGSLTVLIDSSRMAWGASTRNVHPHLWHASFDRSLPDSTRLTIDGDVLALTATGHFSTDALFAITDTWRVAMRENSRRRSNRTRNTIPSSSDWPPLDLILSTQEASRALSQSALSHVSLDADWQLKRSDLASALLPMLPEFESSITGQLSARADGQTLDIFADWSDPRLNTLAVSAVDAEARFSARLTTASPLEDNLRLDGYATAAEIVGLGPELAQGTLSLDLDRKDGNLRLGITEKEGPGSAEVAAYLQLLGDRERITVNVARVNIGGNLWLIQEPAQIDLFTEATVFSPLVLESAATGRGLSQRLQISGALSKAPEDTFKVELDNLNLALASSLIGLEPRALGGNLDASLNWTGLGQPAITGRVQVDTLSVENRLVGSFLTESRLQPDQAELQVSTRIRPTGQAPQRVIYAENSLDVDGVITLPDGDDAPQLDLAIDVGRIDAGFLEELIDILGDVQGGFAGQGTAQGPVMSPDWHIALSWPDGQLSIPDHNTTYTSTAEFSLQPEGVNIADLRLTDPDGGTALMGGWLLFNDYRYLSFDATGDLQALQIMNVPSFPRELAFYGDLRVTGNATLSGPADHAFLRSDNLSTTPQSELLIPVREVDELTDPGFIIYADTTRSITEQITAIRDREHLLGRRPEGERDFGTGLDMDLNINGPPGSSIRLVIDPLLGDVINGVGSARVQLQRQEGEMLMYGRFDLTSGDYMFTAGEVFMRRFLISEGAITWEGDPTNPSLNIQASYQTRASRSGLPEDVGGLIDSSLPLIVELHITGTLNAVQVGLNLAIDQRREAISDTPLLESYLNQPDRAAEHATSVLLTNSFLLSAEGGTTGILAGSAFNSVSTLVANQLNRYLGQVIPNADFTLGVQSDESAADLDVSAGIALRLLDERLVIRGLGVYRSLNDTENTAQAQGLEGEFVVELQLRPNVAVEVFYRRESDALSETLMTTETGLGVNYRAEFISWRRLWQRIFKKESAAATAQNAERAQPQ